MEAVLPDYHGFAVLALTGIALILFTRDKIPLETTSFIVLLLLIGGFQIFPYAIDGELFGRLDFFAGFGNEALITICSLMIIGQAIERTGALQPLASLISKAWMNWPVLALLLTMITASVLSAFMNNTPIIVLLMPILVGVSLRTNFLYQTS